MEPQEEIRRRFYSINTYYNHYEKLGIGEPRKHRCLTSVPRCLGVPHRYCHFHSLVTALVGAVHPRRRAFTSSSPPAESIAINTGDEDDRSPNSLFYRFGANFRGFFWPPPADPRNSRNSYVDQEVPSLHTSPDPTSSPRPVAVIRPQSACPEMRTAARHNFMSNIPTNPVNDQPWSRVKKH